MGYGKTHFGEPADRYPVDYSAANYAHENRNVAAHLSGIDAQLGNLSQGVLETGYIGISINITTGAITRRGNWATQPAGSWIGDGASPLLNELQNCVLQDNGDIYKWISRNSVRLHEDGTDVDLSGGNGQIMNHYRVGYVRYGSLVGDEFTVDVSHLALPGFELFPAFLNENPFYLPRYEASRVPGTSVLSSICIDPRDRVSPVWLATQRSSDEWGIPSGATPQYFLTLANNRGAGWKTAKFTWYAWHELLMSIGYASLNARARTGTGRTALSGCSWVRDQDNGNLGYIGRCGLGNDMPQFGSVSNGGTAGVLTDVAVEGRRENTFGNAWKGFVDFLVDASGDRKVYIKHAPPYSTTSFADYETIKDADGVDIVLPAGSGWKGYPFSGLGFFFSPVSNGNSSNFSGDYLWIHTGGLRGGLVGAAALHGSRAGGSALHAGSGPASTSMGVGSLLGFQVDG